MRNGLLTTMVTKSRKVNSKNIRTFVSFVFFVVKIDFFD